MATVILKFNLPYEEITAIPNTKPPAIPALWNSRYTEITQNFSALATALNGNFVYKNSATGAAEIPFGSTEQRPTPDKGRIRYNETTGQYEGGDGANWGQLGGGATGGGNDRVFYLNGQVVTTNYAIPAGQNAMSAGPITINDGVSVTVPPGSAWTVV